MFRAVVDMLRSLSQIKWTTVLTLNRSPPARGTYRSERKKTLKLLPSKLKGALSRHHRPSTSKADATKHGRKCATFSISAMARTCHAIYAIQSHKNKAFVAPVTSPRHIGHCRNWRDPWHCWHTTCPHGVRARMGRLSKLDRCWCLPTSLST